MNLVVPGLLVLAVALGGCFQPRDERHVIVYNNSGVDLEVHFASGREEVKEVPSGAWEVAYRVPTGGRCIDDTLEFIDEQGVVRDTLEEPCGGRHVIRPEDLDPPSPPGPWWPSDHPSARPLPPAAP